VQMGRVHVQSPSPVFLSPMGLHAPSSHLGPSAWHFFWLLVPHPPGRSAALTCSFFHARFLTPHAPFCPRPSVLATPLPPPSNHHHHPSTPPLPSPRTPSLTREPPPAGLVVRLGFCATVSCSARGTHVSGNKTLHRPEPASRISPFYFSTRIFFFFSGRGRRVLDRGEEEGLLLDRRRRTRTRTQTRTASSLDTRHTHIPTRHRHSFTTPALPTHTTSYDNLTSHHTHRRTHLAPWPPPR
jgi:hypothetical protein